MSAGGWLFMLVSCGTMTGLLGWCIYKIVSTPKASEHLHAQTDIDPGDADT